MRYRTWIAEEDDYLRANYGIIPIREICQHLDRGKPSVAGRIGALGIRKNRPPNWSPAEIKYLRDNWGKVTPETLARKLNRSLTSIRIKSKRLKLGPVIDYSCFTKQDLTKLLKIDHRLVKRWIKQGLLRATIAPTTSKNTRRNVVQVKPGELMRFLRNNPDLWDSRKAGDIEKAVRKKELLALKIQNQRSEGKQKRVMPEYLKDAFVEFVADVATAGSERIRTARKENAWLEQKRAQDQQQYLPREGFRWTEKEDEQLRLMFKQGKKYREMAEALGRPVAGIGHRLARIVVWEKSHRGQCG